MDFLQVSKVKPFDKTANPEPDAPDAGPLGNMDALMSLAEHQLAQHYREQGLAGFTGVPTPTPAAAPSFPRNAPCRRGSGAKYKRCFGNPAIAAVR